MPTLSPFPPPIRRGPAASLVHRLREHDRATWTGVLLLVGTLQFTLEMAIEQSLLPWYSPINNAISDLGGHAAGTYAPYFDLSVYLVGETAFLAALLLARLLPPRRSIRWGTRCLMLTGLGAIGVGVFPEYTPFLHGFMAFIAFLFGGLGLLALGRGLRKVGDRPVDARFTSVCGAVDLVALVLFATGLDGPLGYGGMERLIVAPVLLWAAVFGLRLLRGTVPLRSDP